MLRSFVPIARSGSAPKRALRRWFAARSPEILFRRSIGQSPSMSDVIKMVRPPRGTTRAKPMPLREALMATSSARTWTTLVPRVGRAFERLEAGSRAATARRAVRDAHRSRTARRAVDRAGQRMTFWPTPCDETPRRSSPVSGAPRWYRGTRGVQFPRTALRRPSPKTDACSPAMGGTCGDGSRAEREPATLEIRVRFPVAAQDSTTASPSSALRSSEDDAPHKRGRGGSTPPVATTPRSPSGVVQ